MAERGVEEAEVVCIAYAGYVAEDGVVEASLRVEDECAGHISCGREAPEEAPLEREQGYDCCCKERGRKKGVGLG